MAYPVTITSEDDGSRRVDVTVSTVLLAATDTLPARRKAYVFSVHGGVDGQSLFEPTMPTSGEQALFKGAQYPIGPQDNLYFVDDANAENNGDLIHADGTPAIWNFTPLEADGTPA